MAVRIETISKKIFFPVSRRLGSHTISENGKSKQIKRERERERERERARKRERGRRSSIKI